MHDLVDASCGEKTLAGVFLGKLYYETVAIGLFKHSERLGHPNDGGKHSLYLRAPREDVEAFLDLVEESFSQYKGCKAFTEHVRSKLN